MPCVIVVSQLQLDSLLSLGWETGRLGRLHFLVGSMRDVHAFRSAGFALAVTASEPGRPELKSFSGC